MNKKPAPQRRPTRAERLRADPTLATHGLYSTYDRWKCRCDLCTEATRERIRLNCLGARPENQPLTIGKLEFQRAADRWRLDMMGMWTL